MYQTIFAIRDTSTPMLFAQIYAWGFPVAIYLLALAGDAARGLA